MTLDRDLAIRPGDFALVATVEMFILPNDVMFVVHDKSTWIRQGIAVHNTVAEPGWRGYLTLEVSHHGTKDVVVPAGCSIAQVVFHLLDEETDEPYDGKYQDQAPGPQPARWYTDNAPGGDEGTP